MHNQSVIFYYFRKCVRKIKVNNRRVKLFEYALRGVFLLTKRKRKIIVAIESAGWYIKKRCASDILKH